MRILIPLVVTTLIAIVLNFINEVFFYIHSYDAAFTEWRCCKEFNQILIILFVYGTVMVL